MCDLSISIVSMTSSRFLEPCLNSIFEHTNGLNYEILVVAYRYNFSELEQIRRKYRTITIIESNEIRGFGENHNLALRQARGKYCMVLNDDTFFSDNSIKTLVDVLELKADAAIVSPIILNYDGSVQLFGRPQFTPVAWLTAFIRATKLQEAGNVPSSSEPIETWEISGACFVIRTEVLRMLGFFDEYYFFTPEDIALSTLARNRGFKALVTSSARMFHYNSGTGRLLDQVLIPVGIQGVYHFFAQYYGSLIAILVRCASFALFLLKYIYWVTKLQGERRSTMLQANLTGLLYAFRRVPPKELFKKLNPSA